MNLKLIALFIVSLSAPAFAETKWVLQKKLTCAEFATPTENEGDFVLHKCGGKDFPPLWLLFQDSARAKFGFGTSPNFSSGTGSLKQTAGPVEWGGDFVKGKFEPVVAISRLHFEDFNFDPPKQDSSLQIFRLLSDGTSCLVGSVGHVAHQNAKAKKIAVQAIKTWTCLAEPELFDPKE